MDLPRSDMEPFRHLSLGRRERAPHGCGPGSPLLVNRNDQGISAWCFRCGAKGFLPIVRPLHERLADLARGRSADAEAQATPHLPDGGEYDPQKWPTEARLWMYKAGFSNDTITGLRFYHSARMGRVIMPLVERGQVVYWQARGFDPDRPKYINPAVDKTALLPGFGHGKVLAITEDYLSTVKVAQVPSACTILGTKLSTYQHARLMADGRPVAIMLDPDKAGHDGARRISAHLTITGVKHRIIMADRDPKLLPADHIRHLLMENFD